MQQHLLQQAPNRQFQALDRHRHHQLSQVKLLNNLKIKEMKNHNKQIIDHLHKIKQMRLHNQHNQLQQLLMNHQQHLHQDKLQQQLILLSKPQQQSMKRKKFMMQKLLKDIVRCSNYFEPALMKTNI